MKRLTCLALVFFLAAAIYGPAIPARAANETLTVKGDGLENEIVYSRAALEGLKAAAERHTYSLTNNFPTDKTEYAEGVPLLYILQQAGLKDDAQLVTVTAADGYRRVFTVSELLYAPRYYFSPEGGSEAVPAMVCLRSGTDNTGAPDATDLKLIMGQRVRGEQNNPWIVKNLAEIEVSCNQPEKWPEVTFNRVSGPDGITLTLLHENLDSVKIYYTTDGSAPTIKSKVYNISASYFQPQLNKPLVIDKNTVVKAIAIGAGKENSRISSITIEFNIGVFGDLAGYDWAKTAIESLAAEGIVTGVGNSRFDPAGNLTRGMFVTMLSRALGKDAAQTAESPGRLFPDVDESSWYGAHVAWAVGRKIAEGYPDGTFKPEALLSVEEMIVMTVRAGQIDVDTENVRQTKIIPGKEGISQWAMPYLTVAESGGLLDGSNLAAQTVNGLAVDGRRQAGRAEAAVVLFNLIQRLSK